MKNRHQLTSINPIFEASSIKSRHETCEYGNCRCLMEFSELSSRFLFTELNEMYDENLVLFH